MGMIVDGVYYPDKSPGKAPEPSTTLAGIHHDGKISQMYRENAHELIQPHHPDGTPNQDFIDYYPEDAKNHGILPESEQL